MTPERPTPPNSVKPPPLKQGGARQPSPPPPPANRRGNVKQGGAVPPSLPPTAVNRRGNVKQGGAVPPSLPPPPKTAPTYQVLPEPRIKAGAPSFNMGTMLGRTMPQIGPMPAYGPMLPGGGEAEALARAQAQMAEARPKYSQGRNNSIFGEVME